MNQVLVLLARTPNADAAFVRRGDGTVWLLDAHRPSRLSSEEEAQRAIHNLDFVDVGSTHPDWIDVQRALDEAADAWRRGRNWPGVEHYSVETLLEILEDAEEAGGDQRGLALTLLRDCPAAKTEAVHRRILALLEKGPVITATLTAANSAAQERAHLKLAA